jgi:hypothetical protein
MLTDGIPGDLLQQPVQFLAVIIFCLAQCSRHGQAGGAALINRRVIAVCDQCRQGGAGVADRVGEQVVLLLQARRLPGDNFLAKRDDGLAYRHDADRIGVVLLVQLFHVLLDAFEVRSVRLAQ